MWVKGEPWGCFLCGCLGRTPDYPLGRRPSPPGCMDVHWCQMAGCRQTVKVPGSENWVPCGCQLPLWKSSHPCKGTGRHRFNPTLPHSRAAASPAGPQSQPGDRRQILLHTSPKPARLQGACMVLLCTHSTPLALEPQPGAFEVPCRHLLPRWAWEAFPVCAASAEWVVKFPSAPLCNHSDSRGSGLPCRPLRLHCSKTPGAGLGPLIWAVGL